MICQHQHGRSGPKQLRVHMPSMCLSALWLTTTGAHHQGGCRKAVTRAVRALDQQLSPQSHTGWVLDASILRSSGSYGQSCQNQAGIWTLSPPEVLPVLLQACIPKDELDYTPLLLLTQVSCCCRRVCEPPAGRGTRGRAGDRQGPVQDLPLPCVLPAAARPGPEGTAERAQSLCGLRQAGASFLITCTGSASLYRA